MQTQKVIDHIVGWLEDYATNAGQQGFVVGISGGIDSAVTSSLCALTGLRTHCVEMPIHQHASHVSRANEHIAQLESRFDNITNDEVDLTPVFEQLKSQLPKAEASAQKDLALANARARLRMTTLYYFAGHERMLVAGTGNKVEDFGVGFYTKYGDGGVDLSPIADLLKSEVYELGKALKVPQSIMEAAPSDGLYGSDRTDEDQIGASYDELEWAMAQHDRGNEPTAYAGRQKEVMEIYLRYNHNNQHKMQPIPVCVIPEALK